MEISSLNIGIFHSIVGKNDGVSIVVDQTVKAMVEHMGVPLGNIFFLAAHAPSRFNTMLDESLWHKNYANKHVLKHYSDTPPANLEPFILKHADRAERVIANFVERYHIDLLIAHNTSHPYNFMSAVGLGQFLEKRRREHVIVPRCLVWWHDSHFERERFLHPNPVVAKYLKYLPGLLVDGVIFINSTQTGYARAYFRQYGMKTEQVDRFFARKTAVIPNTCDVTWNWRRQKGRRQHFLAAPTDQYNRSFFRDVGLIKAARRKGYALRDTVILLQHTRIVPRKRIDIAIDFAFRLSAKFNRMGKKKCVALLLSGHSGDEQDEYRHQLQDYFRAQCEQHPELDVVFIPGEHHVFPHREIIVDRKYYSFADVPALVAAHGGLGTYFSEVEGFGNNLLEMMSAGLPVVINRFDVFQSDIAPYNFQLPATDRCVLTDAVIDESYRLLTDAGYRNKSVRHNLEILDAKLNHGVMAEKLEPLIQNLYTYA